MLRKFVLIIFIALFFSSSWILGYALMIDGPQGGHGDFEFLLSSILGVLAVPIGIAWFMIQLREHFKKKHLFAKIGIPLAVGSCILILILITAYFLSAFASGMYCAVGPQSLSPAFRERCTGVALP